MLMCGGSGDSTTAGEPATTETQEVESSANGAAETAPTALDPGTSIDPVDRGKTIRSDQFEYTLLDVRTDKVDEVYGGYTVYLVKLEVERIAPAEGEGPQPGTSIIEVDLATVASPDRTTDRASLFGMDVAYPRSNLGVSLAENVSTLEVGETVIGYYAFSGSTLTDPSEIYFAVRNLSVGGGALLRVANSFKIK
jgi:hypothetical protein